MEEVIKRHLHVPAHLFRPNTKYFITASTYKKKPWLKKDAAKLELRDLLFIEFSEAGWEIEDWGILDNHYHWMANAPENPQNLPNIMRNIHREIALWVKKMCRSRKDSGKSCTTTGISASLSISPILPD